MKQKLSENESDNIGIKNICISTGLYQKTRINRSAKPWTEKE